MIYPPNERASKVRRYLIAGGVVFLAALFLYQPFFEAARSAVGGAISPVLKSKNTLGKNIGEIKGYFALKRSLAEENTQLKQDLNEISFKLLDRNLLYEENLRLKDFLGRELYERTILAKILARPNRSPYDTFLLDVGAADGIESGDIVLYAGGIIVGTIAEAERSFSKARLFSSSGEIADVLVAGIPAIAVGRGAGNFEITLPRGEHVQPGDIVSLPDIGVEVLAVVKYIDVEPQDPLQRIFAQSPLNIFEAQEVEVVLQ